MPQKSGIIFPDPSYEDITEHNYTKEWLDALSDFVQWNEDSNDDEIISEYAQFYFDNRKAGYAFQMLEVLFKRIDSFLGIHPPATCRSPWDYFSNMDLLAAFSTSIRILTEKITGNPEPPEIESIRNAKRSHFRERMTKRIIELEPSKRVFEPEVLEFLVLRNTILNTFLENLALERQKRKASLMTGIGLRQRRVLETKTPQTESTLQQTEVNLRQTASPPKKSFLVWTLIKCKDVLHKPTWAKFIGFAVSSSTVFVLSISCIAIGLVFPSHALYLSFASTDRLESSNADFFNMLGQNVLLGFSLYILVVPIVRGLRLSNEKTWFLMSLALSTLAGICSVLIFPWVSPVSTFLGFIANAAQLIATLLLIQNGDRYTNTLSDLSSGQDPECLGREESGINRVGR